MRETDAIFGGEVSGHYYFHDFFCADSGTIPALLVLELLCEKDVSMVEPDRRTFAEVLHLRRDQLRGRRPGGEDEGDRRALLGRRDHRLDGVSVDYADWHFNVRPSNTEPLLRLNLESLVSPRATWSRKRDEVLAPDPQQRTPRGGVAPQGAPRRAIQPESRSIPTPFAVGGVNCYLLDDDPLTLIDTGPNSGKALDDIERQLDALGHAIEDLELIVITHQHIDHLGLVDIVAERSGAKVSRDRRWSPSSRNYGSDAERDDADAVG